MNYDEARQFIKNGDIINLFRSGGGLMPIVHNLIQFFTGSPVYHCAVAIWMTSPSGISRLMAIETNLEAGKRLIPLSHYAAHKLEVIPFPATADFSKMEEAMMSRVADQPYGFFDLLIIGGAEFFGYPKPAINDGHQVCSELVAAMWYAAGVEILDTRISPGKLRNVLGALGYTPTLHVNF